MEKARRWVVVFALICGVLIFGGQGSAADPAEEVQALKTQVQQLLQRIEQLESKQAKQAEQTEKLTKKVETKVTLATAESGLKVKGRFFAGYFDDGEDGTFKNGSFEVPEAKFQLTWKPSEKIEVVNRLSFNNAAVGALDYFYLQVNQIVPADQKSRLRLGKFKVDFGEETWVNNPVEDTAGLISTSASNTSGYDEGLELYGHFIPDKFGYAVSLTNGSKGTGSDNNSGKAVAAKLFVQPGKPLYLSASYYASNDLAAAGADMSIAGVTTPPAGVTEWNRNIWEFDVKGALGKTKLAAAYGQFTDDFSGATTDRKGDYYYAQALYNFTPQFYAGIRYSKVELDNGVTATLNGVTKADEYTRTSLGVGYRLNKLVTIKAAYDWNNNNRPGLPDWKVDRFAVGIATSF
ncbi:MAG: hypothetical protein ABIK20_06035 [Candidatus Omnitrophota bacterium]